MNKLKKFFGALVITLLMTTGLGSIFFGGIPISKADGGQVILDQDCTGGYGADWASHEICEFEYEWFAQSFVPDYNILDSVKIHTYVWGDSADYVLSIRNQLSGPDLYTVSRPFSQFEQHPWSELTSGWGRWETFDFDNFHYTSGETYYIVIHGENIGYDYGCAMLPQYHRQTTDFLYPKGEFYHSYNSGQDWTLHSEECGGDISNCDCCIKIYGLDVPEAPPNPPNEPSGPNELWEEIEFGEYSTMTVDQNGDNIKYYFNWGDGEITDTSFHPSGEAVTKYHIWNLEASETEDQNFYVRVYAEDTTGLTSPYGPPKMVTIHPINDPPQVSDPSPPLGSTGVLWEPALSVDVSDPDSDSIDVSFYYYDDFHKIDTLIDTDYDVSSGGTASVVFHTSVSGKTYKWFASADDGDESTTRYPANGYLEFTLNFDPDAEPPYGKARGGVNHQYDCWCTACDKDCEQLIFKYDWGDGTWSTDGPRDPDPIGCFTSIYPHIYYSKGTYTITVTVEDINGYSSWAGTHTVEIDDPLPDLIITDLETDPSPPTRGSDFTLKAKIQNIGNIPTNGEIGINSKCDSSDGPVPNDYTDMIGVDETIEMIWDWDTIWPFYFLPRLFELDIDYDGEELSKDNYFAKIIRPSEPDIIISRPDNYIYILNVPVIPYFHPMVFGGIRIEVDGWPACGVYKVCFKIDDEIKYMDEQPSFYFFYNEFSFGPHYFDAQAYYHSYAEENGYFTGGRTVYHYCLGLNSVSVDISTSKDPSNSSTYYYDVSIPDAMNQPPDGPELEFKFTIDYGDGSPTETVISELAQHRFIHNYEEEKIYNISVDASAMLAGYEDYYTDTTLKLPININFVNPITIDAGGPYFAAKGQDINFIGSIVGNSAPYCITWNFGDGSDHATTEDTTHKFTEAGIYTIALTVEDTNGFRETSSTTATISGVELTANPNQVLINKNVGFTASLIGVEPTNDPYYVFNICGEEYPTYNPTKIYTYEKAGNYKESVTVYDGQGGDQIGYGEVIVEVDAFKIDAGGPYRGLAGQPIHIIGGYSGISQWINVEWDFGDGTTVSGSGLDVYHIYNESGNYTIKLTVKASGYPEEAFTTASIYSGNYTKPTAVAGGPYCGNPDDTITLRGTGIPGDGSITKYEWKFSGSSWEDGQNISRKFYASGENLPTSFQATFRVTDKNGFQDTDTTWVKISKINANFHYSDCPNDLNPVAFYDSSAPEPCQEVTSWYWQFGDGATSDERNPSHQYNDDGYYYVKLIIYSGGKSDSVIKRIYVQNVKPNADANVNKRVCAIEENISFNSSSFDDDGIIKNWKWKFGKNDYAYVESPIKKFFESGIYCFNLTVIDDDFDNDTHTKQDYLLIADSMVSNVFDENTSGWNLTKFENIQDAVNATPWGGIVVILDGLYQIDREINIDKTMSLFAIQEGYNEGDTDIQYGGVEIRGDYEAPIFNVTAPNVKIKGFTLTHGVGMQIESDNVSVENCTFIENAYGIICSNSSHVNIYNSVMTENEAGSMTLTNSDNVTIQGTEIGYGKYGVTINNSVDNTIIDCNLTEIGECIQLIEGSNDNTIQNCRIDHVQGTAILIDNSTGNVISDCKIIQAHKGVEVVDVCPDNYEFELASSGEMLNTIQDTDFNNVYYGVYIYNSSYTRIGKKFWSLGEMEGLYPIYYYTAEDIYEGPAIPFPSDLQVATNVFAHNDYPIYIDHSHHNVVDGIAIALQISSYTQNISSSRTGISINHSNNNLVASCLIQNANCSAINITQSENNTVCLCMLKKNQQGITAEGCNNNLIIACSFFNNTDYGLELKDDTSENFVMYNDFVFNNGSYYSGPEEYNQAYDAGEMNMWDDEGHSLWRDMVSGNHELEANESRIIGNFWSDYSGILSEDGAGPIPSNPGSTDWLPTGETPYDIYGPAKSQDCGPILLSVWPESWYVSDDPEWEDPTPEPLPPIPIP